MNNPFFVTPSSPPELRKLRATLKTLIEARRDSIRADRSPKLIAEFDDAIADTQRQIREFLNGDTLSN